MDLPDIARLLVHPDDVLKVQALTALVTKLDAENNDPAFRRQMQLLFDAMQSPTAQIADLATEWIATRATASMETLAKFPATLGRFVKDFDALFTEIFARIKRAIHRRYLFRLAFAIVESHDEAIIEDPKNERGFIKVFLRFASLVPESIELATAFYVKRQNVFLNLIHAQNQLDQSVIDWLLRIGFENSTNKIRFFDSVKGILSPRHFDLVNQHIDEAAVLFWLHHIESLHPASKIQKPSNYESIVFEIARILVGGSIDAVALLLENELILPSPLLLLPLFNFIYVQNQFIRVFPSEFRSKLVTALTPIFRESGELAKDRNFGKPPLTVNSIGEWIAFIVAQNQAAALLEEWTFARVTNPTLFSDIDSLIVLVALFPFADTSVKRDQFLKLLRETITPETESLIVNYHLCQVFHTDSLETKNALIASVSEIKVNDRLTTQIVKFLHAVAKVDDTFEAAFCGFESVFKRNEAIFTSQEMQSLLQIPKEGVESTEKTDARFRLMKAVCLTEWGEKLISKVVQLIQERSDILKHCVDCVTNLSSIEMIEIERLRGILLPKVSKPGQEAALASYCHFLATSVIDEDEEELAIACAAELWNLRTHASPIVREAVYEALTAFKEIHLPETLVAPQENPTAALQFLSGEQLFDGINTLPQSDAVFDAFGRFLSKAFTIDVNLLSRKHFVVGQAKATNESPLFVALIPVLRDVFQNNAETGLLSLALAEPLTRTVMPVSKKVVRCSQILIKALPVLNASNDDFDTKLKAFVSTKTVVELLYNHTREANAAVNKRLTCFDSARSVTETLTKAVSNESSAEFALFGIATVYRSLEATVFVEAATDPLKRAFLPENLKQLSLFRRQLIDIAAKVIDSKWDTVLSDIKLDSALISIEFSVFLILYTLDCSQLTLESSEQLALTLAESYVEASVKPDGSVLSMLLTSFTETICDDPYILLIRALRKRVLLNDETLATFKPSTIKLLGQLFNVDVALADLLLTRLPMNHEAESRFIDLKDLSDVNQLWESFTALPDALHTKYASQLVKRLEKIVKSDKSKLLSCAAELADYCTVFHAEIKARHVLPTDYSRLPDRCILRHAVDVAAQKDTPIGLRSVILKAMTGVKRTDSTDLPYRLPLLDWHAFGWTSQAVLRSSLLAIAMEQLDAKLLYQLTKDSETLLTFDDLIKSEATIAAELPRIADTLPTVTFSDFVEFIVEHWNEAHWPGGPVPMALASLAERHNEVVQALRKRFPDFNTPADLLKPIVQVFATVPGLVASDVAHGSLGALWRELVRGERMDLSILLKSVDWSSDQRDAAILFTTGWLRDRSTVALRDQLMKKLVHVASSTKETNMYGILGLLFALIASNGRLPLSLLNANFDQQYDILLHSVSINFEKCSDVSNASKIFLRLPQKLSAFEQKTVSECIRSAISQRALSPSELGSSLLHNILK